MIDFDDLLNSDVETPQYERFLALNIQVPKVEGGRSYERVTICCSPRDMATDLSLVLPSHIVRNLENEGRYFPAKPRRFPHEVPSPNPKRDPYVVVCSCGEPECQHTKYALSHFERVLAFSQNASWFAQRLRETVRLLDQAEQKRVALVQRQESLKQERDRLTEDLGKAEQDALLVGRLRESLRRKQDELELLEIEFSEKQAEIGQYKQEMETARENLKNMSTEWLRSGKTAVEADTIGTTDEVLSVVQTHFMPRPANVNPTEKLQDNVFSDHHRVTNTRQVLLQLARIEFVRELGISYRHPTKSGKVQVMPEVDTLEVLVPRNGEADIIRVLTTAETKPQQMLAAHMIAAQWDLDVQF